MNGMTREVIEAGLSALWTWDTAPRDDECAVAARRPSPSVDHSHMPGFLTSSTAKITIVGNTPTTGGVA